MAENTKKTYTYPYPRPTVSVDSVIFRQKGPTAEVLLIQRSNPPFKGDWAFPGGFLDEDEDLIVGARRELLEETGLEVGALEQLGTWGTPGRDPRGHTVTVVYIGVADRSNSAVIGGDDAADARWIPLEPRPKLAFDHNEILEHAISWLAAKKRS